MSIIAHHPQRRWRHRGGRRHHRRRDDYELMRDRSGHKDAVDTQAAVDDHFTPIANDIDWWIIALSILIGAALLNYGIERTYERWQKKKVLGGEGRTFIIAEITGVIATVAAASIVGYLVWNLFLGGLVGLVGALASSWVIDNIQAVIARWKKSPETANATSRDDK